eukprot:m.39820 g.39820  ORF g.39820 m.39820 type:complete len:123 (+) comp32833_c0_seq1:1301-1669(+)
MIAITSTGTGLGIVTFGLTYDSLLEAMGWRSTERLFSLLAGLLALFLLVLGERRQESTAEDGHKKNGTLSVTMWLHVSVPKQKQGKDIQQMIITTATAIREFCRKRQLKAQSTGGFCGIHIF